MAIDDEDKRRARNAAAMAAAANKKTAQPSAIELLKQAEARQKELDALAASAKTTAETTITELKRLEETGGDPLRNKNVQPVAPAGYRYTWIGGTTTGSWKLYKITPSGGGTGGGGGGGSAPSGAPGAAWTWNGSSWVRPTMPDDGKIYTWDDNKGWVISNINTGPTQTQVDAIAAIGALLSSYGVGDLTDAITNAVKKGYSADTIQLIMQDPNSNDPLAVAFQKRFPANKARLAAGKAVLSAAEYLAAERTYAQVFQSYGIGSKATRDYFNKFIEGDVSAAEVSDRISLAVNRVQNADATVKKALADYYPMLNQADIVGALLDPKEGLPALQRKIQTAEIGGAAAQQGLKLGLEATAQSLGAQALADLGITQAQARAGFEKVAEVAPRAEFLSAITTGEDYGRLQAEQEQFQGLASAKRARERLAMEELTRFSGQAGTTKVSLARPQQGQF